MVLDGGWAQNWAKPLNPWYPPPQSARNRCWRSPNNRPDAHSTEGRRGSAESAPQANKCAMSGLLKTLHQSGPSWSRAVGLTLALLCFVGSEGTPHAAFVGPSSRTCSSPRVTSQFAIADVDGDRRPDLATVRAGQTRSLDAQYWIAFQLSSGPRETLINAPTGGLQITSRDVNGDDFLDVIVTTAWTNRPVAVLLNDGRGNFRVSNPSTFLGALWPRKAASVTSNARRISRKSWGRALSAMWTETTLRSIGANASRQESPIERPI